MRSLLQFIQRNSNFLVFLLLEVVAFFLIVRGNSYPRSSALSTANRIIAWQYQVTDNIAGYFQLRSINNALMEENASLRERLVQLESLHEDSLQDNAATYVHPNYQVIAARVVQLTTNSPHNFLTINKGKADGVHVNMGVRNEEGVVGIVCSVSEHFALVIPIINTDLKISCRLQKNDYIGTLEWDGKNARYAMLNDIASHIQVEAGDTLVTSGLSPIFPANIPVGIVDKVSIDEGDTYYNIRARVRANFRQLHYVQLIENHSAAEQEELLQHGMD